MTVLRRLLAGVAAAGLVSLTATSCSATPSAATVNGHSISQSTLDGELRALAGNPGYVKAFNQNAASVQIQVMGANPGASYSTAWVTYVLTQRIQAEVVHQAVVRSGSVPGPGAYAAARALDEIEYGDVWRQFPVSYRDTIVQRDAERAQIEPTSTDSQTIDQAYQANRKYFFSQVCIREVDVATGGGVSDAQAKLRAQAITDNYNLDHQLPAAAGSLGQQAGGAVTCFSPADLENQPVAFVSTVMGLAPGQAAPPKPTAYGYRVIAVDSRRDLGLTADTERALSVAISAGRGQPDAALSRLLAAAHVKINPAYGSWNPGSASRSPGVQPPPLPLAAPAPSGASTPAGG